MANNIEAQNRVRELSSHLREAVTGGVEYEDDPKAAFTRLAETIYPDNLEEQNRYAAKIERSLTHYLARGMSLTILWQFLKENQCTTLTIDEGSFRAFSTDKEIDMRPFFDATKLEAVPAEPAEKKANEQLKEAQRQNTKSELAAFYQSLRAGNPDLPEIPT